MTPLDIFLNRQERLRSGWRFAVFCAAYFALFTAVGITLRAALIFSSPERTADINRLPGGVLYALQFVIEFAPALLLGWGCGRLFDGVPFRALGFSPRRGWLRDLALGSAFGFASLALAALVATVVGGFHFSLAPEGFGVAFVKTFFGAVVVYLLLAAAEEMMFRGYPLQTLMRSLPFVAAFIPPSAIFALIHTSNPNVPRGLMLAVMVTNTALAGVWLCVGYLRTRNLWLPLGLHWSWNWAMGSVLGLPVSGITSLTRAPLVRATDAGPSWLTGGSYGIEGGAACTLALLLATVFVWKTKLLRADDELKKFTDGEQPQRAASDAGEIVV
ncbi:MAG: CPBP family intramembrane metalloprotease [Acidobacteria bacterium]|nr:CPBP family intramembrane metalloprotease [Acidobacteriota bacterium]